MRLQAVIYRLGVVMYIIQDRQHGDDHDQPRDPQPLEFILEKAFPILLLHRWKCEVSGDEEKDAHHKDLKQRQNVVDYFGWVHLMIGPEASY